LLIFFITFLKSIVASDDQSRYDDDEYDTRIWIRMPTATASYGSPPTPSRTPSTTVRPTPTPSPTFVPSQSSSTTPTSRLVPPSSLQVQVENITDGGIPDTNLLHILSLTGAGVVSVSLFIAIGVVINQERQKKIVGKQKRQILKRIRETHSRTWTNEDAAVVCKGTSEYRHYAAANKIRSENPDISTIELEQLAQVSALHSNMASFLIPSVPQQFAYFTRRLSIPKISIKMIDMETNIRVDTMKQKSLLSFRLPALPRDEGLENCNSNGREDEIGTNEFGAERLVGRQSEHLSVDRIEEQESNHSNRVWVDIDDKHISSEDTISASIIETRRIGKNDEDENIALCAEHALNNSIPGQILIQSK
jgi:hypothetical protein